MRIINLLHEQGIELNGQMKDKADAIDQMVVLMHQTGVLANQAQFREAVYEREKQGTTGVGEGVAIPHAKTNAVKRAGLAAMVVPNGVSYDSLDGHPVYLIFLIASPDTEENIHLTVLSRLSMLLMDGDFRNRLIHAASPKDFLHIIDEAEREKFEQELVKEEEASFDVLAVTACPTGIAHTYMAAQALENQAKKLGISIKVETNGSGGVKNILCAEDIQKARCIIVAADKNVEMTRFDGKPVIQTKVANGIHKAEQLLQDAMAEKAPIYHSKDVAHFDDNQAQEKESVGRHIYKHLMNGVSHMLPFVIGGGILIALAFLFDNYEINPANFGSNTPFAALLKGIGDAAFGFMLPVLAGYIAASIGERPALAVGFVGGYLSNIGGSGFLGALFAGFLAGYIIVGLKKIFSKLPQSLEGIKPVLLYPFFGILIIGLAIVFVINPPVRLLNELITGGLLRMGGTSKVLLGALLGGMMAIDMGGPINKAAYVFGTAAIASGQYEIMAAVMAGGMVPPLAIALATTFFKNRFTKQEQQSGMTNYVMGLSFITEGAIPYAAADPMRVIPSCVVGAAVAGGLSMFFGCTLLAPHGGIFVIPVIGNGWLYLISLAVGSVVGMLLLGIFKKQIYS